MHTVKALKHDDNHAVVVANEQGIIIYVNAKFEEIFQWLSQEIIGLPVTTIIPPNFRDAHHLGFARFQNTEQSTILNKPLQLKALKKNGDIFLAEHLIQAEKKKGVWHFAARIIPVKDEA